jgi:hypothetical protein
VGKEQYHVEISNWSAVLEDFDAKVDINSIWEPIRENTKISTKESLDSYEIKTKDAQYY